jgi:PAS domain S-box-containing protein
MHSNLARHVDEMRASASAERAGPDAAAPALHLATPRHADPSIGAESERLGLLAGLDEGVLLLSTDGAVIGASPRAAGLLGLEPDDLAGLDAAGLASIGIDARLSLTVRRLAGGRLICQRRHDLGGGCRAIVITDVGEIRRRFEVSASAQEDYRSLFENTAVGIYRSSLDGRQLRANPAYVRMNGYRTEAEMIAAMPDIARQWYVDPSRRDEFVRLVNEKGVATDFISEVYRHGTGERMWVSETGWLVRDDDGTPLYYEGTIIDATERILAEAEIARHAQYDTLTGLANRSLFTGCRRSRCSISTSTPSSRSTTLSATRSATNCCGSPPAASSPPSGRRRWWHASAVTSSPSWCASRPARPTSRRSPRRSSPASASRSISAARRW